MHLVRLIRMVPELNCFKLNPLNYPKRPPEADTKNSINKKMTISQKPLIEIDPTLCYNVSCVKPFGFFAILHSKMAAIFRY